MAVACASLGSALGACASDGGTPADASDTSSAAETAAFPPCEQACLDGNPVGTALLKPWYECQDKACAAFQRGTDESDSCIFQSWAPTNPQAACQSETRACFSGPSTGCKELVDLAAATCEPAQLPMSDGDLMGAARCMVQLGWDAEPSVQALAWPLYQCVFSDPPDGCTKECENGAAACRTCAASKCKPSYDACIADAHGTPITPREVPAGPAACRSLFRCLAACQP